jgi:glycosyltransferase involved in cell wall biosynthesis
VSVNQRLSSPNKFWEALLAGTPVVVPAGLEFMAGLVRASNLGAVAASESAADLAVAIRSILDRPASAREAWRTAIGAVAQERFAWPLAEAVYRDLVRSLQGPTAAVAGVQAAGG